MYKTTPFFAFALVAATLTAAQSAAAQGVLSPATPEKGFRIEATHTQFKGFEANLPTAVWYFSARLPLSMRINAVADVPFSHARQESFGEDVRTSSVFGNPYVGIEHVVSKRLLVELGTRVPLSTADEESFADVVAFVADPLRPEAFAKELLPVSAAATFQQALPAGFALRARGGVTTFIHTGQESSDTEAAIDYGVLGTYTAGPAQVGLGVTGRWYATSDEGSFAETSLHHAGLNADVRIRRVRPGVSVRVPLDSDYREVVKSSVGVYLQVPLQ